MMQPDVKQGAADFLGNSKLLEKQIAPRAEKRQAAVECGFHEKKVRIRTRKSTENGSHLMIASSEMVSLKS